MKSAEDRVNFVLSVSEISNKKREKIKECLGKKYANLHNEILKNSEILQNIVGNDEFSKILDNFKNMDKLEAKLEKYHVDYITIADKDYPYRLREIPNPPYVLYYIGDISILNDECIAVVGTRKPSAYGKEITEKFVKALAKEKFCIVSGLAYGVDTIAHQITLNEKAKTIAVLASGLDNIYPAENERLAEKIVESGGCLVSEYYIGTKSDSFRFPIRNRIISGLSLGVLVTQASQKSGSLITANYAIEQNRELFVIPANLNLIDSKGTNSLIASIPECVTMSPDKIVLTFRAELNQKSKSTDVKQMGLEEGLIIELLKSGEKTFDELLELTHLNPKMLNQKLTTMEISGIIKRLAGNTVMIVEENL